MDHGRARPRRRRVLGVVAALAVLAGGVVAVFAVRATDPQPAEAAPSASATADPAEVRERRVIAGIDAALKARAAAVEAGRLDDFLARTDPRDAKLRAGQTRLFANLRKLGLSSLEYRRQVPYVPEAVGGGRYEMRVAMLLRVRDVDPAPRITIRVYTFAERSGRWLITADKPDPRADSVEPWDLDPIEVVRRAGVVAIVDSGEQAVGVRLAKESAAALTAVRTIIGRAPSGILVVGVSDRRAMGEIIAAEGHLAVAVARHNRGAADPDDLTLGRTTGSRIIVNAAERRRANRYLLSHEFTHVVMAPLGGNAPLWLVEGLAEYTLYSMNERDGYREWVARRRAEVRRTTIPKLALLPIDGVFRGSYGEDSYGTSWVITEYLVRTYGGDKVLALYAELARSADDPDTRERLLRKHLGVGESAIVAAVKRA